MELSQTTKFNILLFLCAIFIISLRAFFLDTTPDSHLVSMVGEKVSLTGYLSEEADVRDSTTRYTLVSTINNSKILLVAERFPSFMYGDKIKVEGTLELPENFETENGTEFDYISYLSKDHIHFIIYRPNITFIESGGNPVFKFLFKVKNFFLSNVSKVLPEPNASLMNGLIFGGRQSLGEEILATMKNVGLIHIVAISGYNVTIIAVSILSLCSYIRKRNVGLLFATLAIVLFAIMVGLGSTVIRASVMAIIAILARYLGRPNQALRALIVAVFCMLLWNPLLLTRDPSFQLSVMATLGLILFSPFFYRFISECRLQKYIPEKYGLREIISSSLAVQLFLLPLLIKMSGILSLVSFVVNIFVLPLIPFTMLLGFLTGLLGILGPVVTWPLGAFSFLCTSYILKMAEIASKFPGAFMQLGNIPNWIILLWYGVYFYLFIVYTRRERRRQESKQEQRQELL